MNTTSNDIVLESSEKAKTFIPYNGSKDWVGFRRSEQGKWRHYDAKCDFCGKVITGRVVNLRNHKKACVVMPQDIRDQVAVDQQLVWSQSFLDDRKRKLKLK